MALGGETFCVGCRDCVDVHGMWAYLPRNRGAAGMSGMPQRQGLFCALRACALYGSMLFIKALEYKYFEIVYG